MGLFEILLIAVVTLLVVGPERMPEAVRSTALTIGRIKRWLSTARTEIEKQVGADEIRQQLHNEAVMDALAQAEQSSFQLGNSDDKKNPAVNNNPAHKKTASDNSDSTDEVEEHSILANRSDN